MRSIFKLEQIPFPDTEVAENFKFETSAEAGAFKFHFKWLNNRWNVWVTLPDGSTREAGVCPNVISWSGHTDYGLVFKTDLVKIDYTSLFLTELYLITWE